MEQAVTAVTTVGAYRRSLEGYLPYTDRLEWKNAYRAATRLFGDVGYGRFKAMAVFGSEPETPAERDSLSLLEAYRKALADPGSAGQLAENKANVPANPGTREGMPLQKACGLALSWAGELSQTPAKRALLTNACLAAMGLGTARLKAAGKLFPGDPDSLAWALASAPRTASAMAATARRWETDELVAALSALLTRYPLRKAFLFGSHADGTQVTGSDADLALVFRCGLTYADKVSAAESIRLAVPRELGLFAEVRELLEGDEKAVSAAKRANYVEIQLSQEE